MPFSVVTLESGSFITPPGAPGRDFMSHAVAAMLAQPVPGNTLMAYTCTECGSVIGLRWEDGPVAGDPEQHFRWHDEQFASMYMKD